MCPKSSRILEIQEEAVWDSELTELEQEELQDFRTHQQGDTERVQRKMLCELSGFNLAPN